ncbi:MAG: hypothetical protein ACI88H_003597 [Cocleimonas sp.]|jgi:hypothetical protein
MDTFLEKGKLIYLIDICFGGSATAFSAFKVSAKNGSKGLESKPSGRLREACFSF